MKRYEKTDEEVIAMISKKWTPASTLEEAKKRTERKLSSFVFGKDDLNSVWNLFKETPEIFLFDELINEIRKQYTGSHTYEYNNAKTQLDNFEFTIDKLRHVARKLYDNLLNQNASHTNAAQPASQKVTPQKATAQKGQKRQIISAKLKKALLGDKTKLADFVAECDQKEKTAFLNYLAARGIVTLDDYLAFCDDRNKKNALYMFVYSHNMKDVYNTMSSNIIAHAFGHHAENVAVAPTQQESGKKVSAENTTEAAPAHQEPEKKDADQDKTAEGDFYEALKKLPASHFVKGSEEMEKIAKKYGIYLEKLASAFVEDGFSEEDVKEVIDAEDKKYQPIVDAKRAEHERELHKSAVAAYAKKLISDSVKYHHDPKTFSQPKQEGHKHFPDNGREL